MSPRAKPIRRELMHILLLTSGVVLIFTTLSFLVYQVLTFRQTTVRQLSTLSKAIADISTAALAFNDADDARSVLAALKAEPHIAAAALYDHNGALFASYPGTLARSALPAAPGAVGYRYEDGGLAGFTPVMQGHRRQGTLYVRSDLGMISERMGLLGLMVALVTTLSGLVAYLVSTRLQRQLSAPILALAAAAQAVTDRKDYELRAPRAGLQELDVLTDAFNQMLMEITQAERRLLAQLGRLSLLQEITRAIGDRLDLRSICQVLLSSLEEQPAD